ncbi:MAG: hypothetical protein AB7V42_00450 [Thermoleophilia bacterium]
MSTDRAEDVLGPLGRAALAEAVQAVSGVEGGGVAKLRVAGWTAPGWAFRFELPGDDRRLVVVQVPHDGGPATVREQGLGPDDPLAPEDLRRT